MGKIKRTEGQTMVDNILCRKLNIIQL